MPRDRIEMPDEPPPFLGSWPRVYTVVLVYLAALIVHLNDRVLFPATGQ